MSVIATITTSIDGFVTGPDDGPEMGLGRGGERLHNWVMGGPWTYEGGHDASNQVGADRDFIQGLISRIGSGICGRGMFEAAGRWGGTNPFGGTLFVVTHRTDEEIDPATGFVLVGSVEEGLDRAIEAAAGRDVGVSGGADVIRQALALGRVDELALSTAPVVLGAGKRLFAGFTQDIELDILEVHTSPFATHVRYAVRR